MIMTVAGARVDATFAPCFPDLRGRVHVDKSDHRLRVRCPRRRRRVIQ